MCIRDRVVLDLLGPIMGECHSRQAFSLSRGINLAVNTGVRKVADENAVRAALGQSS